MDVVKNPRTTRDALTLELLGDIGRLDDMIKALPEALKESLAPTLGALVLASKEVQTNIEKKNAAEKISFENFAATEKIALRESLKETLREEAGAALADVAKELSRSMQLHADAANAESRQRWQWLVVAFAGSIFAGAIAFYGSHLLYGEEIHEQAAFGRAVGTVWDSLDAKTKERIQTARKNQ